MVRDTSHFIKEKRRDGDDSVEESPVGSHELV